MSVALIKKHRLRPADVVVVKKAIFGLLDHYMVFMGNDRNGNPWFMANMEEGVKWVSPEKLNSYEGSFKIDRIRRFKGSQAARQKAISRAENLEGKRYSAWRFNCEHFANYVQEAKAYSQQASNARNIGGGLALGLLAVALINWGSGSSDEA